MRNETAREAPLPGEMNGAQMKVQRRVRRPNTDITASGKGGFSGFLVLRLETSSQKDFSMTIASWLSDCHLCKS